MSDDREPLIAALEGLNVYRYALPVDEETTPTRQHRPFDMLRRDEVLAVVRDSIPTEPLDVERLGFRELLDIGEALIERYPPDTIASPAAPETPSGVKHDPGACPDCHRIVYGAAPETREPTP